MGLFRKLASIFKHVVDFAEEDLKLLEEIDAKLDPVIQSFDPQAVATTVSLLTGGRVTTSQAFAADEAVKQLSGLTHKLLDQAVAKQPGAAVETASEIAATVAAETKKGK